ncbi:response regulator [Vibrio algarum]|uniref:Transcriptional regulatory protein n=1 Tax=Vibrio algarum TaxID=3020714 RepID=A0ABT4YU56_9VIBR|nr:response regulator [Vibrio sp. KJ40-1]MDB1125109.1 response regulator [Vibrio sp. KJ40-1]
MKVFNILIVEDEPNIADFHSTFFHRTPRLSPVGIARNIKEARSMIAILKPDLVIMDNYLPDGKGIDLMKELSRKENPPNVIFVTAASDMETVRNAIRAGAFDYLLKPISYDRLSDSIERFLKYMGTLESRELVSQRHVDQMLNFQANFDESRNNLPTGIDELTLNKIRDAFFDETVTHTADSLLEVTDISKTTARRYLDYCAMSGYLQAEINHGKIGRPERRYRKKTIG